jgi:hypothetical protein
MLKLTIVLASLAAVTGCADSARDREIPASDVPRRPLEMARAEEPQTTAQAEEPQTTAQAEEPRTTVQRSLPERPPAPRKARVKRSAPAPQPAPAAEPKPIPVPAPVSEPAPATDTVAAEPPEGAPSDTAPAPDPDSQPSAGTDTAGYTSYPAAEPVPETAEAPAPAPVPDVDGIVGTGAVIHATLEDSIHSRHDVSGKEVHARVMQNVTGTDGKVLIPAGSPVRLTVTQVKPGRGDRKGVLELRTDSITIDGRPRKLEARIQAVPHELRGRGVTGEEAAKVGVGAAGGAVVGRVITGNAKGAVIGGVVGAAGGAVVASETAKKDVVVKARTPVDLVLTAPLMTR